MPVPIKIVFVFASSLYGSEDRSLFNETGLVLQSFLLTKRERIGQRAACFSAVFFYLMTRTHCDSVLETEVKMAALNVRLRALLLNV